MPPDRDLASLSDMRDAATDIVEFARGKTYPDYLGDKMLRAAVERKIEIMGEAAKRVSAAFKTVHPEIPWQPITVQRHIVAHDYDNIKHERLWRVVTVHAPKLIELLAPLLPR